MAMPVHQAAYLGTKLVLFLCPELLDASLLNINTLYLFSAPKLLVCGLTFLGQKGLEAIHVSLVTVAQRGNLHKAAA